MKRRPILVVTGFVLVAFGLGVGVGTRLGRRPRPEDANTVHFEPALAPDMSPASGAPPCEDIRNAASVVGRNGCITGLVVRVYTARTGNTFLDFCQDYRTCPFTSVVFASDQGKFGNLQSLQGKRVEIRGDVVPYQGRAEIIIHDPAQVRSAR